MVTTTSNSGELDVTVVSSTQEHTATIIFCHGLGQSISQYDLDIEFLAQRLPFVKWVRPQAREQRLTYYGNSRRSSWFNIFQLPPRMDEFDEVGIVESISVIEQLILGEVHSGLDPRRVILVGFGQGAALCLMTALTTLHDLGGVGSLSGWIPHPIRENIMYIDPNLPIFWAHGRADTEIPIQYARNSIEFLEQRLCMNEENLRFIEYADLQHEVSEDELRDLAQWALDVLDSS
ncbi:hypothetical protein ACEPAG_945 [Sanghuangporus baumii]